MKIAGGKFVITGGASLIGSHVAERLLQEDAREVVLLDNFALGTPDTVRDLVGDARIKLVRGDILRVNELYDAFAAADGVFAIAGFLTLPLSQSPPLGLAVNVACANVMAMAADASGESFNVVTGVATSVNRVVELLLKITGSRLEPEYRSGAAHVRSSTGSQLDFSRAKIEKMIGWRPEITIEDGIRRLIDWRRREATRTA